MGFDRKTVERVMRLVDLSEYKRGQAPPAASISLIFYSFTSLFHVKTIATTAKITA